MVKKIICIFLFAVLFLHTPIIKNSFAFAVRVDQAKVRLGIAPGELKTGSIRVENNSNAAIKIKAYLEDWYYIEPFDGSKEFASAGSLPLSCANWISFAPAEFTLPAYGAQAVNFTVNVPKDAKGGHFAVMFFETGLGETQKEEGVTVNVLGRIGTLFYIEPQGTIKKAADLTDFSIARESFQEPLEIKATFNNIGNTDITANGNYYIIDNNGVVYARGEFSDVYTLPNDTSKIHATWKEKIPEGKYDIVLTLDFGQGESLVKEASLQIGPDGQVTYAGGLK